MAFEVPTSLIREAQIALRNEAGLSSYDPEDTSLPKLQTLDEAIAGFDPSPHYLRCQQCRGRLLRGLQSMVCVYCGAPQRREPPPDPISFRATFGYRWLLSSLDLDGSEDVGSVNEVKNSNKGHGASKNELRLSDLLDLELRWPAEREKVETSITNKKQIQSSSLDLAGVDLDNFFSKTKNAIVHNFSEEQVMPDEQTKAFPDQQNLVENFQSSGAEMGSAGGKNGDTFFSWEAEFQSASSATGHDDAKSSDPFHGSMVGLSSHVGTDKDVQFIEGKPNESTLPLGSTSDNFFQDDQWNNSTSLVSDKTDQFNLNIKDNDGEQKNNTMNNSSAHDNWFKDENWQACKSDVPNNEKIDEFDDSYDAWQDFTGSVKTDEPSQVSWKQIDAPAASTNEHASDINLGSLNKSLEEVDFGVNSHTDLLSGVSSHQNISTVSNNMELEALDLSRLASVNVKAGGDDTLEAPGNEKDTAMHSNVDKVSVETLMSQMHDLSFMLENKLSIPQKAADGN